MKSNYINQINLVVAWLVLSGLVGCQAMGKKSPQLPNKPSTKWMTFLPDCWTPSQSKPAPRSDLKLVQARRLEMQGETEQAIQTYSEILKEEPGRTEALHRLAVLYDLKEETSRASGYYQQALALRPRDARLLCDFAYHHYLCGHGSEAETLLNRALREEPNSRRAHNNLGLVMVQQGRIEEAFGHFNHGAHGEVGARVNLAYALMWNQRWNDAAEQVNRALEAAPTSPEAQRALSTIAAATSTVDAYHHATPVSYQAQVSDTPSQR